MRAFGVGLRWRWIAINRRRIQRINATGKERRYVLPKIRMPNLDPIVHYGDCNSFALTYAAVTATGPNWSDIHIFSRGSGKTATYRLAGIFQVPLKAKKWI